MIIKANMALFHCMVIVSIAAATGGILTIFLQGQIVDAQQIS
jgi:hypothetical protein